jgi:hypothetical protein
VDEEGFLKAVAQKLKLFVEVAGGAGNVNAAGNSPFAILHPLHDTRSFIALWAFHTFGGVHHFGTVCGLGYLCHGSILLWAGLLPGTQFR